jgi:hypothetical protein
MLHANYASETSVVFRQIEVIQSVTCNVHFGTPGGSGDCLQVGICRVIIDQFSAEKERRCRKADAELYINEGGQFEMFFAQEGIMPCTERAIFKSKWFPVPVAHTFDEVIMDKLGNPRNAVIPMGKYPITKVEGGYIISF